MYFQCLFLLIYKGGGWFSSAVGAGVGGGGGVVVASFALLDFLAFFFFFFLAVAEVDGAAVVVAALSSASGGDGGGVKTWTGSAAVQESVSEVEVMGWEVRLSSRKVSGKRAADNFGRRLPRFHFATQRSTFNPRHHASHVYSE